jgi:hypothetical protein
VLGSPEGIAAASSIHGAWRSPGSLHGNPCCPLIFVSVMHRIESDEVPRYNRPTMERKIFLKLSHAFLARRQSDLRSSLGLTGPGGRSLRLAAPTGIRVGPFPPDTRRLASLARAATRQAAAPPLVVATPRSAGLRPDPASGYRVGLTAPCLISHASQ